MTPVRVVILKVEAAHRCASLMTKGWRAARVGGKRGYFVCEVVEGICFYRQGASNNLAVWHVRTDLVDLDVALLGFGRAGCTDEVAIALLSFVLWILGG